MAETYYAVKIEDLVSKEFWDIIPAKSRKEAFEIAADTWARHGGRPSKIRLATAEEIRKCAEWHTMTREEHLWHEKY